MKIGAERKKIVVLLLLLAVAAVLFYREFASSPAAPSSAAPAKAPRPVGSLRAAAEGILESRAAGKFRSTSRTGNEFRPTLKRSKPGEGPDPLKLDPTLRTDLLAKLQAVNYQAVERNLFQFGPDKPKPVPKKEEPGKGETPAGAEGGNAPNDPAVKPPDPTAPPVNMKYYGYANRPGDGRRRAFLIEGEDIIVAAEGEVIKKRYRVVRIGINSLVVEDMQFRSQQTLPLQES